ncbi:hypothetical protein GCM10011519_04720 [Marmoricola endophyticus]|uniref:phospholipase D n=1 Tax=Marmoricola endophyticus TaxID=2040280 RepID=A0A917BBJ3_9ACTN|nr:phospholipase D-like domain-containing protein [Marmoricola endophyticus]GGF34297.1 hypothetical protein GCM10011519_04720 [Marmoricola endophyticus]
MSHPTRARLAGVGTALVLLASTLSAAPATGAEPAAPADCPSGSPTASPSVSGSPSPTPEPSSGPDSTAGCDDGGAASQREDAASPSPFEVESGKVSGSDKTFSQCAYNAGRQPAPVQGTYFNYPYGSTASKRNIRDMVIKAVNSSPACESVSISVYSLNDDSLVNALIAAYQRGVRVRVIVNSHMVHGSTTSKPFLRLVSVLHSNTQAPSFAIICRGSCRGTGGNHHSKMYLFSRVVDNRNVTMMGTHNSTMKAVNGQWNSLDVYDDEDTFDYYSSIFDQEVRDRPVANSFADRITGEVETFFFPKPGTTAANDPFMVRMRNVGCTGVSAGHGRAGRTLVRVGMYAWHDDRGIWLAKRIRALWDAGCDVAIEYAIIGNTVKRILYSPAGRGRIPMRQVATSTKNGTIVNYLHQKYVTISGREGSNPGSHFTMTGTSNWANLGLVSDDSVQLWRSVGRDAQYRQVFYNVWRGPKAHVPSPTSALPAAVGTKNVQFGKGKYKNLEEN